ncbi:MAG: hypothetical protein ACI970_001346 [Myxococcota bacterium]|jgi:uncharacterized protein YqgV (UPF0045/DUF77 family)
MLIAFSVTPLGVGAGVGDLVADCVRIVRASGLDNETNAMFTLVEGAPTDVFAVVLQCMEHVAAHAPRASLVLKGDLRPGHDSGQLRAKKESIELRLLDE